MSAPFWWIGVGQFPACQRRGRGVAILMIHGAKTPMQ
jgi:hypothetical protein